MTSAGAAERFGIAGKGRIEPGADADLALVDLAAEYTLRAEDLLYRHPHLALHRPAPARPGRADPAARSRPRRPAPGASWPPRARQSTGT